MLKLLTTPNMVPELGLTWFVIQLHIWIMSVCLNVWFVHWILWDKYSNLSLWRWRTLSLSSLDFGSCSSRTVLSSCGAGAAGCGCQWVSPLPQLVLQTLQQHQQTDAHCSQHLLPGLPDPPTCSVCILKSGMLNNYSSPVCKFCIKEAFCFAIGSTCSRDNVLALTYWGTKSSQEWQQFHKEEGEMTVR